MAKITLNIKGRGVYKIKGNTVDLKENAVQNVTYDITNSSDSYEYEAVSPELISLFELAYKERPSVPVPIYASDNRVKSEIEGSNSIVDLIVSKAEDNAYKDTKNIKYVTIRGMQAGTTASALKMFKRSKVQYVRFTDNNYLTDAREMFASCELLEDVISPAFLQTDNCDYIFSYDRHFAKNLGDDGVVKMLMSIGVKDDWYNGLNRTYFWDCPYNGTLPEFLATKLTSGDLYAYQKSFSFDPNELIPKVLNAINSDDRLDTYNYTINKDTSIKPNIKLFDSSNLLKLHFDNTDFSTAYSKLVYGEGPDRPADPDPEITITDNYDDKVKGAQNLLYNIKDIWDFAAFKNTVNEELELTTSVVLNVQHNGPKLNDIVSPIWDPDDNFRLNIISLDASAYIKKPVGITERYWIPKHHQETFWKKGVITETNIGPVFNSTNHDENWNVYDLGHNLGQGRSVKWTTVTYNDIRDKYVWTPPTLQTYGFWSLAPYSQKEYIPMSFTVPDRSHIVNGTPMSGYETVAYESYVTGGPIGGPSTPGASENNPPITGQRPKTMQYFYNKDVAESYVDWVAGWSGDASHPDRTRTIQVPFNMYLNDNDCPPQDISDAFKDVSYIKSINFNRDNVLKADNLFMNCKNLQSAVGSITNGSEPVESAKHIFDGAFVEDPNFEFIVDTLDAESAFENSNIVDPTFFKDWRSVLNGNKVFKNSKVKHIKEAILPERIQTIAEAFADCESLVDVEGNWLQPNSSMHYQNYTYHSDNTWTKDWINPLTKDGFYFPDTVQDIHSLFKGSGLQSVKDLKLLLNGNNDNVFFSCEDLTDVDNLYLNENPNYANIFWDTPKQNSNWRIWFPTNIKSNYAAAIDIGLDPYKVSNLYCDDGFIVVDNESPDVQVLRRSAYERILNPEKKFKFNYFSHIHPHTIDNNRFFHEIHDADVWYK